MQTVTVNGSVSPGEVQEPSSRQLIIRAAHLSLMSCLPEFMVIIPVILNLFPKPNIMFPHTPQCPQNEQDEDDQNSYCQGMVVVKVEHRVRVLYANLLLHSGVMSVLLHLFTSYCPLSLVNCPEYLPGFSKNMLSTD